MKMQAHDGQSPSRNLTPSDRYVPGEGVVRVFCAVLVAATVALYAGASGQLRGPGGEQLADASAVTQPAAAADAAPATAGR